jgi:hypothetical protein
MTKVIWALITALTLVLVIIIGASAWMSHFIAKKEKQYFISQISQDVDSIFHIYELKDTLVRFGTKWIKPSLKYEEDFDKKIITFVDGQSHQINDQLKITWEAIFSQYGAVSLAEAKKTAKLMDIYKKYRPYSLDAFESDLLERCKQINLNESGDYLKKLDRAEACYTGLRTIKRKMDVQNAKQMAN